MAEVNIQELEDKFYQKIILYNDLFECLKRERACLISIELDSLWDISSEKEDISARIKSLRQEIVALISSNESLPWTSLVQVLVGLPGENGERLKKLTQTIDRLKADIETLRKENISFVDHSLLFIDEIISIIAGETQTGNVYNQKCRLTKSAGNVLLCREV